MRLRTKALGTTAAAVVAIATPLVANWEGLRTEAYRDIGGVWTVCYGETDNIDTSREYTKEECDDMLSDRIPDYYQAVLRHVEVDIPITMQASLTSFVYNVGETNFKKSTMLKKINDKDLWGACSELDRWSYVGSMWVKGLNNRRKAEKRLCIAELPTSI